MQEQTTSEILSAEILAIGTELLMGQIVNTNAAYLAKQLRELGISSKYQTVVGDNEARIIEAVRTSLLRSDLLLLTGGLGPTEDDISMLAVAKALDLPLELHEASWARIKDYFLKSGRPLLESNKKQAFMPKGAIVMPNDNGTAPGAYIQSTMEGKTVHVALLPGPPAENRLMFERYLKTILMQNSHQTIQSKFLRLMGIGESQAEEEIRELVQEQTDPTIAMYASDGELIIRLTTIADRTTAGLKEADTKLDALAARINEHLGSYIYRTGEENIYEYMVDLLSKKGITIGLAESCTSGLLAAKIGEIPGASKVFNGGIISYSNDVKTSVLAVKKETLDRDGAVSENCAIEMANGARRILNSDYGISITGIAGPDGGSQEKPVGTVYIAIADANETHVRHISLSGNRRRIQSSAALWAMNELRRRVTD